MFAQQTAPTAVLANIEPPPRHHSATTISTAHLRPPHPHAVCLGDFKWPLMRPTSSSHETLANIEVHGRFAHTWGLPPCLAAIVRPEPSGGRALSWHNF